MKEFVNKRKICHIHQRGLSHKRILRVGMQYFIGKKRRKKKQIILKLQQGGKT